ncbi:helix-turn-helix domain-containing protein [Krasilnikovia sp. MM14-A1259]|uniref:helix-turn-helix domain-containing protein n=1 Tax=Krasilnikovia sp. MM14-A1259 TaxID=3373539 RepID=UPI0037FCEC0E
MDVAGRKAPTIRLRRLAGELRRLRVAAGLKQEEVAERTGLDASSIYRIERALNRPQRRTVMTLLNLYGVNDPDRQATLLSWLKDSGQQGWFQIYEPYLPEQYQTYIGFEYEAESLLNFENQFVPGLLQTEDYARAVIRNVVPNIAAEDVERRVEVRLQRQIVFQRPTPMQLWAIVDEAAVRREVGGRAVMQAQLKHLVHAASSPHIKLQVVPFEAGAHPGMPGSCIIMNFADPFDAPLVYLDSLAGDLFLDTTSDVERFSEIFQQIATRAMSPTQSKKLIQDAVKTAE